MRAAARLAVQLMIERPSDPPERVAADAVDIVLLARGRRTKANTARLNALAAAYGAHVVAGAGRARVGLNFGSGTYANSARNAFPLC